MPEEKRRAALAIAAVVNKNYHFLMVQKENDIQWSIPKEILLEFEHFPVPIFRATNINVRLHRMMDIDTCIDESAGKHVVTFCHIGSYVEGRAKAGSGLKYARFIKIQKIYELADQDLIDPYSQRMFEEAGIYLPSQGERNQA
jgi:hypothetical protein